MSIVDDVLLQLRRSDVAPARALRDVYRWAERWNVPMNRLSRPMYASLFRAHDLYETTRELAAAKLLYEPMVRARFAEVGEGIHVTAMPYIRGHARVRIGRNCKFGYFSIASGRFVNSPELVIGDHVSVGTNVRFVVNRRITIGDRVGIAGRCWISDSDGHPSDPDRRMRGEDITPEDIDPVTIEDRVWLGHGVHILKGVTLGESCVVAAGSVVNKDVPPGALAMGVPARIIKQPW
jgi:acetyltransferase-like isoleucine patch superfamily enzyme